MRRLISSVRQVRGYPSEKVCRCTHTADEHLVWHVGDHKLEIVCPQCDCKLDVLVDHDSQELIVIDYVPEG